MTNNIARYAHCVTTVTASGSPCSLCNHGNGLRFSGSGYPAFLVSLLFIGILTAVVEQVASLLGCVWGIKQAVSGITLVALGTSLPDTFASRSAALHDDTADAAIGNVTGKVDITMLLVK